MPEYQWLCWLAILMFVSSSRSTFCNTRPCRWLAILIMILSLALKQDIAVQCCEDLKCRIRVGKESHFIGCWAVGKTSSWFWGESSPHRQRCRDDCVNVKLFVKLFVITRAAGQRGRERRCRDGLRSHLGSDQAGSRGQSPESREEAVIITRVFTLCRDAAQAQSPRCLAHAAPGKDVVFMHRLLCFLPIVSLFWRNSILCFTMTLPHSF